MSKSQSICLCGHSKKLHDSEDGCTFLSCDCEQFTPESDYGDRHYASRWEAEDERE